MGGVVDRGVTHGILFKKYSGCCVNNKLEGTRVDVGESFMKVVNVDRIRHSGNNGNRISDGLG